MRQRLSRRHTPAGISPSFCSTLFLGAALWIGFPSAIAYQDMVSLVSGVDTRHARWGAYVEKAAAGSVHQAEMPFLDTTATGSVAGGGVRASGMGMVALRDEAGTPEETPDEMRVNRADKRERVVRIAPVAPPRSFTAGSIFERRSSLIEMKGEPELRMAFAEPQIAGREIEIASVFHAREERRLSPSVPTALASLVTNDKADILATAYAPPPPDFASQSPFASLLGDEDAAGGRFVPPVGERDHAWMNQPLPPGVFGAAEQKCLAEGIYFEARSESLEGQAAVAQVILNRVRNPAYPATICGVVYQNRSWRNRCQFSFACEGRALRIRSPQHYKMAQEIAMAVTAGKIFLEGVGSATHYHATYVNPRWARSMERVQRIGLHIFYRTHGGGWS